MAVATELPAFLRVIEVEMGLATRLLADRRGVSPKIIARWGNGRAIPNGADDARLRCALQSFGVLFDEDYGVSISFSAFPRK